jgi:EAL domain-containing protein (putative c-di-GMP-specific phosphodiesterase class I)
MRDTEGTIAVLRRLADHGVHIALDDFGTGFSSMSYLKRFPVHKIKVDRAFVADVTMDRGDAAIVRAVGTLGQELGIRIAAEGVETAEQAAALRDLGCDEVQGFHFGVPMPARLFERRLHDPAFSHRFRVLTGAAAADAPAASVTAFRGPHRQDRVAGAGPGTSQVRMETR